MRGSMPRRLVGAATLLVVLAGGGIVLGLLAGGHTGDGSGGPASASPTASTATGVPRVASTPTLDPADTSLVSALRPFAVTDCHSAPREGAGVVAAVSCTPGSSTAAAAPAALFIVRFASADTLQADVRRRSAGLTDTGGGCAQGRSSAERWAHSSHRRGTFICQASPGRFAVYWTVDDSTVGFAAEEPSADQFLAWWRDYDPI
ncbi:Serine/threonine protein kinase [Frankia sp. AiPs1]|uniref:hypothetical protein n=1 Tax=Frankia sp. AiPa1 TaxID=573492 RepID=UPI00202B3788|nr:hypothetical protein [Frankia sp. AiPa1]MCL9757705.1 hypothetical protein [Frankia sp. AiPa1]